VSASSLPLFPLGTVLFPGGLLPLRIFEVRYLDMIGQCHRSGTPFGVVALQQGSEVQRPGAAAESFHAVGTMARIVQFEATQPGLMTILCQGAERFRITDRRQLKHGLWTADVDVLPADLAVPVPDDLQSAAQLLNDWLQSLRNQGLAEADWPMALPLQLQDCGWLANRWCELLPLPAATKQQLMELDNPLVRLELVVDLLARQQDAPGPAA
jgi:Lon protease-like protein